MLCRRHNEKMAMLIPWGFYSDSNLFPIIPPTPIIRQRASVAGFHKGPGI